VRVQLEKQVSALRVDLSTQVSDVDRIVGRKADQLEKCSVDRRENHDDSVWKLLVIQSDGMLHLSNGRPKLDRDVKLLDVSSKA